MATTNEIQELKRLLGLSQEPPTIATSETEGEQPVEEQPNPRKRPREDDVDEFLESVKQQRTESPPQSQPMTITPVVSDDEGDPEDEKLKMVSSRWADMVSDEEADEVFGREEDIIPPPQAEILTEDELLRYVFGGSNLISSLFAYQVQAGQVVTLSMALALTKAMRRKGQSLKSSLAEVLKTDVISLRGDTSLQLPPSTKSRVDWRILNNNFIFSRLSKAGFTFPAKNSEEAAKTNKKIYKIKIPNLRTVPQNSKLLIQRAKAPDGSEIVVNFQQLDKMVVVPEAFLIWGPPPTLDQLLGRVATKELMPTYDPEPRNTSYDSKVFEVTKRIAEFMQGTVAGKAAVEAFREMYDSAMAHVLSNGSPEGLIGRLEVTMKRVAARTEADPPTKVVTFEGDTKYVAGSYQGTRASYNEIYGVLAPFADRGDTTLFTYAMAALDKYYNDKSARGECNPITNITPSSDPGIIYEGVGGKGLFKSRLQSTPADLLMSTLVMYTLNQAFPKGRPRDPDRAKGFWKLWRAMLLVKVKPKYEIEVKSKLEKKWRNIFVPNSFAHIAGQMLWQNAYKLQPTDRKANIRFPGASLSLANHDTSILLAGFSPFYGGLGAILSVLKARAKRCGIALAVYADNLYLMYPTPKHLTNKNYNPYTLVSFDGSSMESCVTRVDVETENERLLTQYWGGEESGNLHHSFITYLREVFPRLATDVHGVLKGSQFVIPGMASGTLGTFNYNTSKMVQVAAEIIKRMAFTRAGEERQPLDASKLAEFYSGGRKREVKKHLTSGIFGLTSAESTKVAFTSSQSHHPEDGELALGHLVKTASLRRGVVLKAELVSFLPAFVLSGSSMNAKIPDDTPPLRYYELDLLGFDAVVFSDQEVKARIVTLILSKERFVRSLVYAKTEYGQEDEDSVGVTPKQRTSHSYQLDARTRAVAIQISRLRTLYLMGGWAYPEFSDTITVRITDLLGTISNMTGVDVLAIGSIQLSSALDFVMDSALRSVGLTASVEKFSGVMTVPTIAEVLRLLAGEDIATEYVRRKWVAAGSTITLPVLAVSGVGSLYDHPDPVIREQARELVRLALQHKSNPMAANFPPERIEMLERVLRYRPDLSVFPTAGQL